MIDVATKQKMEEEIFNIFSQIQETDKGSLEYKKLFQKIYTPIWRWSLLCFKEDDVRKAGVEIFHCIKRSLLNYKKTESSSYIAYLYTCLETEIRHKIERAEVKKFKMCTRDEYSRAVKLVKEAARIGKNPSNENVQVWLAKQSGLDKEDVNDLIIKYYQSQIVEEQIMNADEGDEVSIFDTAAVTNDYLTPEQDFFKTECALEDIMIIERVFDKCQERQKQYLSSFITLKLLLKLEKSFLMKQIIELMQDRTFLDSSLLEIFVSKEEMPTQGELAAKYGKDEGYVSNRISEFFEKVQRKISI